MGQHITQSKLSGAMIGLILFIVLLILLFGWLTILACFNDTGGILTLLSGGATAAFSYILYAIFRFTPFITITDRDITFNSIFQKRIYSISEVKDFIPSETFPNRKLFNVSLHGFGFATQQGERIGISNSYRNVDEIRGRLIEITHFTIEKREATAIDNETVLFYHEPSNLLLWIAIFTYFIIITKDDTPLRIIATIIVIPTILFIILYNCLKKDAIEIKGKEITYIAHTPFEKRITIHMDEIYEARFFRTYYDRYTTGTALRITSLDFKEQIFKAREMTNEEWSQLKEILIKNGITVTEGDLEA